MNAYHVFGGLLALWALVVSFLGITRERFPGSKGTENIVAAISVVLVIAAVAAAILTAAAEEEEGLQEPGEEAAFLLPR